MIKMIIIKKLKIYNEYFKYIMEHKKNVFKVCWKRGLYVHAFTHDLSKFSPVEFFPYAEWFYGEYGANIDTTLLLIPSLKDKHERCKRQFDKAWEHHQKHNKHHWDYWCYDWNKYYDNMFALSDCKLEEPADMPLKYIIQMICDWKAMSLKFGGTAQEFYMNNYDKIKLSLTSRVELEYNLGLIDGTCLVSNVTWKDYCERINTTMKDDLKSIGYIK